MANLIEHLHGAADDLVDFLGRHFQLLGNVFLGGPAAGNSLKLVNSLLKVTDFGLSSLGNPLQAAQTV